jgi:PEP-CTERM/exosortase A-associated glycosyltransferase
MLRILHILDHSLPLHSGYAFRTVSILQEQRALGWETFHLTTPKQGESTIEEEWVNGWHFFRTPTPPGRRTSMRALSLLALMRRTAARIADVVSRTRPNVLHVHSPVLNALPALWVGRSTGLPVVYEMRALWEAAAVDHGTTTENSIRYNLSRRLETFALLRAAHVTTICEGLRSDITSRGVPPDRVTVIPNAVDPTEFPFGGVVDPALRASLGLTDSTVLGFAGSFYAYEGLDLLIEALPGLVASRPDVKLLLVGGGFQEAALKEQARTLGVADRVIFTGRVPHDQVQRYYDLIDVLVYPRHSSLLTELVTPLKPLEAMAQGRVLVASDVGGHKELIRDGETGLLFKAGDVQALQSKILESLALTPIRLEQIRRAGREFVETERTWAKSVARYADVYARLVKGSSLPTGAIARDRAS